MSDFGDVLAAEALNGGPSVQTQAPVTFIVNGNSVVTYVQNGVRFAAIGTVPADAQALLTLNPLECQTL